MDTIVKMISDHPIPSILLGYFIIIIISNGDNVRRYLQDSLDLLANPRPQFSFFPKKFFEATDNSLGESKQRIKGILAGLYHLFMRVVSLNDNSSDIKSEKIDISRRDIQILIGQLILLFSLIFFFIADFIAVNGILQAFNLPNDFLLSIIPSIFRPLLGEYAIAVTIGTYLSLIISGFMALESWNNKPAYQFLEINQNSKFQKRLIQIGSIVVLISSLFVGIFLGVVPLFIGMGVEQPPIVSLITRFCIDILVRANVLITTLLILQECFSGAIRTTSILILSILILICIGLYVLVNTGFGAIRIVLDIVARIVIWFWYTIGFLIYMPLTRTVNGEIVNNIVNGVRQFGKEHRDSFPTDTAKKEDENV